MSNLDTLHNLTAAQVDAARALVRAEPSDAVLRLLPDEDIVLMYSYFFNVTHSMIPLALADPLTTEIRRRRVASVNASLSVAPFARMNPQVSNARYREEIEGGEK